MDLFYTKAAAECMVNKRLTQKITVLFSSVYFFVMHPVDLKRVI
jgi:hypothetical protein